MADTYYSEKHEWLSVEGETAKVGITTYATEQLGDIIFVELPDVGKQVSAGDEVAVVESVKTAGEIYTPVAGTITAVNDEIDTAPETVNDDPEGKGWFFEIKLSGTDELAGLMNKAAYDTYVEGL